MRTSPEQPQLLRVDPGVMDLHGARAVHVREAVLKWCYNEALRGRPRPVLNPGAVMSSVRWDGAPLTRREVIKAVVWLGQRELLDGNNLFGVQIERPVITDAGRLAAQTSAQTGTGEMFRDGLL